MRNLLAIVLLASIAPIARSQGYTSMDAVAFCRGADSVQLEVYYSVLQKLLPFKSSGTKWTAPIDGSIEIFQDGQKIKEVPIHKEKTFVGTEDEFKQHIADDVIDGAFFTVAAKTNTKVVLILNGLSDTKQSYNDTISRVVQIPVRKPAVYQFANVEYASSMQKTSDKSNFFEKVGFVIMPNPSRTFGGNYTKLYYYTEMNVPVADVSASNNGTVEIRVLDATTGKEMFKTTEAVALDAAIVPVIGSAEIDGLPTESYILALTLVRNGRAMDSVKSQFFYDSGIDLSEETEAPVQTNVDENGIYLNSGIATLTELEVDERAAQTLYGATEAQRKEYRNLRELDARRRWLYSYWRDKDKEANAQPLSQYRAFLKRVDEANRQFTIMKVPGWKSSRGRVYIQYGKPDQTTGEPFAINSKPYIQWEYLSQKIPLQSGSRAEFIFVDKQGGGNFVLVSSNARGEQEEDDWFTREAQRTIGN